MTAFDDLGASPVINAAGKMTALGGSAQSSTVASAQAAAASWHVDMADLRARAGQRIAAITGAQAASITTGAAAGIAISVAATIVGDDMDASARLPLTDERPNRILIEGGHLVNFGAPVDQMIRLGGGDPLIVGSRDNVSIEDVHDALASGDSIAAFLFVQSHHAAQENMVALADVVRLCRAAAVPVIVDAAAEEDLTGYIALGADLVTYSGGKAIGGPTSGFITGRADLVEACEMQTRGIARTMKVGKEQIAGLMTAIEAYASRDREAANRKCAEVNGILMAALRDSRIFESFLKPDEAGRGIERVAVGPQGNGFDVRDLVSFLVAGTPSIRTRNHQLNDGIVLFDPREVSQDQAQTIAARLLEFKC